MVTVKEKDTELKIKEAARIMFQKKGFDGTKTRDIAQAADINLALLNYYFRSKRKLYDIIMTETMQTFFGGVIQILDNPDSSIEDKLESFVEHYIDLLLKNNNIPHFILNHVRENPEAFMEKIGVLNQAKKSYFFQQFVQATISGKMPPINPLHFFMNLMGLLVFPFLAQPMLAAGTGMTQEQFREIIEDRKRLIPLWISAMLQVK